MFEILADLKKVVDDVKSGNYLDAGKGALVLAGKALDLFQKIKDGGLVFANSPEVESELDAKLAELELACKPVMGASDAEPNNMGVIEIIAIVKAVMELIKFLRDRKKA